MKLFIAFFLSSVLYLTFTLIFANPIHAASFTVAAGNDENTDNSSCSLTEAITNINAQSTNEPDCVPTGAYGTDDTINLPAGTITLTADLTGLTETTNIIGQGMSESIIDGNSLYSPLSVGSTDPDTSATITGFKIQAVKGGALRVQGIKNVVIEQIEVDGTGTIPDAGLGGVIAGLFVQTIDAEIYDFNVSNVYIHDLEGDVGVTQNLMGIAVATGNNSTVSADLNNISINNLHATGVDDNVSGIQFTTGWNSYTATDLDATVSNATASDLTSDEAGGGAVVITNIADNAGQSSTMNLGVLNSTVYEITSANPALTGAIFAAGAEVQAGDDVAVSITATNNIIASTGNGCKVADITNIFAGVGSPELDIVSGGGNLTDDTSCNSYFTEPTDQNNVSGLGSTLSALADNGGYVPTMALKQGSPAIDSGITIPTLTTDARGAIRPQGNAYDSGAYESPYTQSEDEETDNLAETGRGVLPFMALAILLSTAGFTSFIRRIKQRV